MTELKNKDILLDNSIDECESILKQEYIRVAKQLDLKLRKLYQDIEDDGDKTLTNLYQYNRYYDIINAIQNELQKLGSFEKREIESHLIKLYLDNTNIINKYGNSNFTFNPNLVKEVVNENWGGRAKNWSDCLWSNKSALAERIRSDMVDIITTGKSYSKVSEALSKDMGVGYNEALRLVRTEMARVASQSSLDIYAEMGIEMVKVITSHDDRVCSPECEEHEGHIIPLLECEVGINIPPFHPNCRCGIVAIREDSNV